MLHAIRILYFFFFNDTATTEIYTLSLHDALPIAVLILAQPGLGNCLTLVAVTFALLYLAGSPVRYLGFIIGAALPFLALAIWLAPYRLRRITTFLDPWSDPRGSGFQIIQSWLALGSGGLLGRGIGESKQKLFYLPEAHTDFIFAVIGEELGFVGALAIIALFAVLVWRGLRVGLRAPHPLRAHLGLGRLARRARGRPPASSSTRPPPPPRTGNPGLRAAAPRGQRGVGTGWPR